MWKENGKKKQDSDWKPMCQAERRAERRMQDSDWKPMCQAEVERAHKARNWLGANVSSRRRRTERRRQDSDWEANVSSRRWT